LTDTPITLDRTPMYVVLFDGTVEPGPYTPLVAAQYRTDAPATIPHGLDHEVVAALPGLWYCLHLPTSFFDLVDIPPSGLVTKQSFDLGQHILLVPVEMFVAQEVGAVLAQGVPVLAICPDALLREATHRCASLGFALPPTPYSELGNGSLEAHWHAIYELVETDRPYLGRVPQLSPDFALAPVELPRRWLARQLDGEEDLSGGTHETDQDAAIVRALDEQVWLRVAARVEESGDAPENADALVDEARALLRVPVALAAPGVAPTYVNNVYDAGLRAARAAEPSTPADRWTVDTEGWNDATAELSAIRFLATHRAIARSGVGITLPDVSSEAFGLLAQLEAQMRAHRPRGRAISRLLERLALATADLWTPAVVAAVTRASTLTAFTNFPVGLLRLPGDTGPLAARVPITYRPLLPLTRAVQAELSYVPLVDVSDRARVLVAECIPRADPVGALSRRGWMTAQQAFAGRTGQITLDLVETSSVAALREAIAAYRPDLIVISAHGVLSSADNVAGLRVGDEDVLGIGLGPLPPVVILSACHVAPRGAGTVSIVDLLLREGAIAVLGTQVPVDVRSNTMLTVRFLVNIAEVLAGREEYGGNLLDVWRHVQAGNAVLDILGGSPSLRNWGHSVAPSGRTVLEEFMMVRSAHRLRAGDIYADAEAILGTIADDMGGERVRNWFRNPGYVPESLFYAFAGSPERVHLRSHSTS
jgi:CHAT domain-containing protein